MKNKARYLHPAKNTSFMASATHGASPYFHSNLNSGGSVDNRLDTQNNNDLGETEVPHGEIVMIIARGVGFLVAIVAIVLSGSIVL